MKTVKLIVDSACDLPFEILKKHEIDIIPMHIIFAGQEYKDYLDLDQEKFLEKHAETREIPKTSLPDNNAIRKSFEDGLKNTQSIVFVTISSKGSGTYNAARLVKEEMEEEQGKELDITIIDSYTYSLSIGRAVFEAAIMADEGKSRDEIVNHINYLLENARIRFIVSDLMYLKKGGRIKATTAVVAGVLGIVPILTAEDGLIVPIGKERGVKKAIARVISDVKKEIPTGKTNSFWLVHCDAEENVQLLKQQLENNFDVDNIFIHKTYGTVSTHAGPGVCAVFYQAK